MAFGDILGCGGLAHMMTPEQIAEAQRLAREWDAGTRVTRPRPR